MLQKKKSPVLEPLNSILELSIVSEHVNSVPEHTNSFSNSVDCIADSLNCIVKPSCSIEPLSPNVHKDTEMLFASDTSVAQNRKTLDKIKNVEDCFNELINSILDVDTFAIEKRAKEKLNKDNIKFKERSLNDDDAISCLNENANFLKMSKKAQQFFIVPKMTSTPENGRPVIQSANQHQGVNGLKLSEMSSIPYISTLNPQFEQSDYESSLLKLSTDVQIPLFQSPCKDNDETEIVQNVHPVDTKVSSALKRKTAVNQLEPSLEAIEDKLIEEMNQHFSELENTVLCIE
ncbi:hypothetical protein CEXT_474091 [Caerostris extrusa]|uniref:Uncharacterized protein n=1 Tax=Caerostris extrusa TaxID=172846 RepID=A0AAV4NJ42_CAEEX|nr:hypothetical protein CEXT_474091 [Caerostris extrusa]